MRLSPRERHTIKNSFLDVFKDGEIYLFGSRVDPHRRGGDIDLYIRLPYLLSAEERVEKRKELKLRLYETIGEQKIDIIVSKDIDRSIEKEAVEKGILL
jgi:predicted nucleotidyltransferase